MVVLVIIIETILLACIIRFYRLKAKNNVLNKTPLVIYTLSKAIFIFSLFGFILAYIIISRRENHPHSMIGLLYIFLPTFGTILGLLLGLIFLFFKAKHTNKLLISIAIVISTMILCTFLY